MAKKAVPTDLEPEQKDRVSKWFRDLWPFHFERMSDRKIFLRRELDSMLDWHRANGQKKADYEATLRVWIRKTMDAKGYEPRRPPSSPRIPGGKKPFEGTREMERLGPLFSQAVK